MENTYKKSFENVLCLANYRNEESFTQRKHIKFKSDVFTMCKNFKKPGLY